MDTGTLTKFECSDWFGKKKGDGKLVRDIPAKERGKQVIGSTYLPTCAGFISLLTYFEYNNWWEKIK